MLLRCETMTVCTEGSLFLGSCSNLTSIFHSCAHFIDWPVGCGKFFVGKVWRSKGKEVTARHVNLLHITKEVTTIHPTQTAEDYVVDWVLLNLSRVKERKASWLLGYVLYVSLKHISSDIQTTVAMSFSWGIVLSSSSLMWIAQFKGQHFTVWLQECLHHLNRKACLHFSCHLLLRCLQ